jgi:hypothetical protein
MSFLLDALRKSERIATRRVSPSIHSIEPDPGPPQEETESAWQWLLVLPALLVMVWLGLKQFGALPGAAEPAETSTTRAVPETPDRARVEGGAPMVAELPAAKPLPAGTRDGARAAAGARTPVEVVAEADKAEPAGSKQPEASPRAKPRAKPRGEPAASQPVAGGPARTAPVEKGGQHAADESSVPDPRLERGAHVAGSAVDGAQAAAATQSHIDYSQLPAEVRDQLPEFNITVLVYAERPEDRFILVNGARQREGEELQPGLRLLEIRRDGALFNYRHYRFLVSR